MSMVFLRDDLDAENIRDGNTLPVRHLITPLTASIRLTDPMTVW